MAGKHRRGIVGAGYWVTWSGDLAEKPGRRGWFTPAVEPGAIAWPKRDEDAEAARLRAEASRVARANTPYSIDVLSEVLAGLARL